MSTRIQTMSNGTNKGEDNADDSDDPDSDDEERGEDDDEDDEDEGDNRELFARETFTAAMVEDEEEETGEEAEPFTGRKNVSFS